jgi:copper chaperone CopZ
MRFLIVICFFLAYGCGNTSPKKSTPEVKAPVEESLKLVALELSVQGMTCTGCEQTIQSGLSNVQGVKHVKANYKDGKAYVEILSGQADTARIRESITSSGYVLASINSTPLDSLRLKQ